MRHIAYIVLALAFAPAVAAVQTPSRQAIEEAARRASPRSGDEALKYFEAEFARKTVEAIKRVYDPNTPAATNPPRTPWGVPDLRGYYLTATYTPLERPKEITKRLYTIDEAIQAFMHATTADVRVDPATVHYDWKEFGMEAWQSPVRPNLRTSLIVDPPDGTIPPLTPEAQKRRADAVARAKPRNPQTGVRTLGNLETRCVMGDGAVPLVQGGSPTNFQGSTDALELVERFTVVDANTLRYEYTVTDPKMWTRSWSVEAPLPRIGPPIYEFACHEQNYGLINVVRGAQIREAEPRGRK